MSDENSSVEVAREITLYNVRGGNLQKIQSFAKTWGELKSEVRKAGFDVEKSLVTESINKTDLVSDLAVLPTGAFRLYLRPKEVKSGLDRKELFAAIKEHITVHPEAKQLFIIDGCNMTQLSTTKLQELYDSHILMGNGHAKPTPAPAPGTPAQTPSKSEEVVSGKKKDKKLKKKEKKEKKHKEEEVGQLEHQGSINSAPSVDSSAVEKVFQAIALIESLPTSKEKINAESSLNRLLDSVRGVEPQETEEEICAREAREIFGK